jgi:site-specific recombinase XerD
VDPCKPGGPADPGDPTGRPQAGFSVKEAGPDRFRLVDDSGEPVTEANEFLDAVELKGLSHHTVRAYAFDLALLYRWLRDKKTVRELTPKDLLDFIAIQRATGSSPNSINRRLTTCRLLYRFCTDRELGHDSPGSGIDSAPYYRGPGRDRALGLHRLTPRRPKLRVKAPRRLVEPLTTDEVRLFLRSLRRYRDLALVHILLFSGLRSDEVLRLRLDDLLLDQQRLRVRGKGNKERIVPIAEGVIPIVLDCRDTAEASR